MPSRDFLLLYGQIMSESINKGRNYGDDTMNNQQQPQSVSTRRSPITLHLRDVFLVLTAVVSIVAAWGMYGTRLSVAEEKLVSIGNNLSDIRQMVKDLKKEGKSDQAVFRIELTNLETRLRRLEEEQARIQGILKHH